MAMKLNKTMILNEMEYALRHYKCARLILHIRGECRYAEYFSDRSGNPIENLVDHIKYIDKNFREDLKSKKFIQENVPKSEIIDFKLEAWS